MSIRLVSAPSGPRLEDLRPEDLSLRRPRILVFDSGLGGLSVFAKIVEIWPGADYLYLADDAVFPYGALAETVLVERVLQLMARAIPWHRPDIVVVACHTASTLVLPPLRRAWPALPFVGTVPAIKPAAAASASRMLTVLATPGTVARDYTQELVRAFAHHCRVTLVGATALAGYCEALMRGQAVAEAAIAAEIAPAFVESGDRRTDVVVLACTHYPLLGSLLPRLAPWPVTWIDPAPAIARRVGHLLREAGFEPPRFGPDQASSLPAGPKTARACFTGSADIGPVLRSALAARGLTELHTSF